MLLAAGDVGRPGAQGRNASSREGKQALAPRPSAAAHTWHALGRALDSGPWSGPAMWAVGVRPPSFCLRSGRRSLGPCSIRSALRWYGRGGGARAVYAHTSVESAASGKKKERALVAGEAPGGAVARCAALATLGLARAAAAASAAAREHRAPGRVERAHDRRERDRRVRGADRHRRRGRELDDLSR